MVSYIYSYTQNYNISAYNHFAEIFAHKDKLSIIMASYRPQSISLAANFLFDNDNHHYGLLLVFSLQQP